MNRDPLIELPQALRRAGVGAPGDGAPHLLLGVDGGATKTLAAALDLRTGRAGIGRAGPSNADTVGAQAATEALLKASEEALAGAGADGEQLDGAVLAVAGTDIQPLARRLSEGRSAGWIVVNDVIGAWAAATGAQAGVGVIAGTGSNVLGIGPDLRVWRAGGWGHVFGDEGSGYWLAVQAVKAALADRDGSGPLTALSAAAVEFFGVQAVEQIPPLAYGKPFSTDEIAAFATEGGRVAAAGDRVARAIYDEGACRLARQIGAVIEHAGLRGRFPVGLIGSAFKAGECYLGPLTREIHRTSPEAQVSIVEMAPVGGSLLLAARAAGDGSRPQSERLASLLADALAREPA